MGCDIHLHIEVKINGKWEHYSTPHVKRNYTLFALMADVRSEGRSLEPISAPKGLPEDMSVVTALDAGFWDKAGHSESWLSAQEISELEDRWRSWASSVETTPREYDLEHVMLRCYFFSNSFGGFHKYPDERPKGIEDLRFVFWFDN